MTGLLKIANAKMCRTSTSFVRLNLINTVMSKRYLKSWWTTALYPAGDPAHAYAFRCPPQGDTHLLQSVIFASVSALQKAVSEVDVRLLEHCVKGRPECTCAAHYGGCCVRLSRPSKTTRRQTEMLTAEDMPGSGEHARGSFLKAPVHRAGRLYGGKTQ